MYVCFYFLIRTEPTTTIFFPFLSLFFSSFLLFVFWCPFLVVLHWYRFLPCRLLHTILAHRSSYRISHTFRQRASIASPDKKKLEAFLARRLVNYQFFTSLTKTKQNQSDNCCRLQLDIAYRRRRQSHTHTQTTQIQTGFLTFNGENKILWQWWSTIQSDETILNDNDVRFLNDLPGAVQRRVRWRCVEEVEWHGVAFFRLLRGGHRALLPASHGGCVRCLSFECIRENSKFGRIYTTTQTDRQTDKRGLKEQKGKQANKQSAATLNSTINFFSNGQPLAWKLTEQDRKKKNRLVLARCQCSPLTLLPV